MDPPPPHTHTLFPLCKVWLVTVQVYTRILCTVLEASVATVRLGAWPGGGERKWVVGMKGRWTGGRWRWWWWLSWCRESSSLPSPLPPPPQSPLPLPFSFSNYECSVSACLSLYLYIYTITFTALRHSWCLLTFTVQILSFECLQITTNNCKIVIHQTVGD